jgi:hypothetical protein
VAKRSEILEQRRSPGSVSVGASGISEANSELPEDVRKHIRLDASHNTLGAHAMTFSAGVSGGQILSFPGFASRLEDGTG